MMQVPPKIKRASEAVTVRLTESQKRRTRHHSILVTVAFVLFWIPVAIFAKLAGEVVEKQPIKADTVIIDAVHAGHTTMLDNFFLLMTALGEPLVVAGAGAIIVVACLYKKWYRAGFALVTGVGGALAANLVLKAIFARIRPSIFDPLIVEKSYSFPSGHSMVSAAFVSSMILILWHTKYRWPAVVLGVLATLLIGVSRVYLGVHYPTDVVAGWSVGLVWAIITGSLILNRPFALGQRIFARFHHE